MIHNGSKRSISASSGLKLLQMVLEPVTERYVSENVVLLRGVDCEILHQLDK